MVEFEEPEKGYVFQGTNLSNKSAKKRVILLFLLFFTVIGFIIKNDYSFDIFKKRKGAVLKFSCSYENMHSLHDSKESSYAKAKKALAGNEQMLEEIPEFIESGIEFRQLGNTKRMSPVIDLYFTDDSQSQIPEKMCEFRTKAVYR